MKKVFLAAALTIVAGSALADVGVSINVSQPGFYGRIDIASDPQPQVVYQQPVMIEPAPVRVVRQPIYLYVPPAHYNNWARYCHQYNACNQPVYFVHENWYRSVYVPHHFNNGRYDRPVVRDDHRYEHRDERRDDHRDDRREDRRDR
jgi:hypothetical protein